MDLGLKKRVDDGEMVLYSGMPDIKYYLFRDGKKYNIEFNGIIKKANYSFNVISKELELLKAVHNLREI